MTTTEDTGAEPFPESQLPTVSSQTIKVTYGRKMPPEQYGNMNTEYTIETTFTEELHLRDLELVIATQTAMLKNRVGAEMGIKTDVNEEGVIIEVSKAFPGATRSAPAASTYAQAPAAQAAPQGPEVPDDGTIWAAFVRNPDGFYNDLGADKPKIKDKQNQEVGWLNEAPDWFHEMFRAGEIPIPAPRQGGGGGGGYGRGGGGGYGGGGYGGGGRGGGGYGGGRTGGGGGYRR